jgi:hypothetical protein
MAAVCIAWCHLLAPTSTPTDIWQSRPTGGPPVFSSKYTAQEISGVPLETVRLRYELVVEGGAGPREHAAVFDDATFTLASGIATLAGRTLRSALLSRTGVHFSELLEGLGFCTGVFRFSPDRLWLRGYLHYGPDVHDLRRCEVMGAVRDQTFDLETQTGKRATLTVGYSGGSVREAPTQRIELDGTDISRRATLEHVPGTGVRLHIRHGPIPPGAKPDWLMGGSLSLDLGTTSGTGIAQIFSVPEVRSRPERWTASGAPAVGDQPLVGIPPTPPNPILSVQALAICSLAGAEAASQALIQANMLWCMEQTWIDAFFPSKSGPSRPDLSPEFSRMDAVDQDCEWYNTRFAAGMLGVAVDDAIHKLSASDRLTLDYYLTNQIALDPAYTRQTQAIATQAATTACPALQLYVADWQQNGTNWGQLFLDYLDQPPQLSSMVNTLLTQPEGGMAQLDDYATILTVFDPTGGLASTYYNNVILAFTGTLALQADFTQDTSLQDWLPDYINDFINNYYTGKTRPADPGADQTAFDIAEDLYQATVAFGPAPQLAQKIVAAAQTLSGQPMGQQAQGLVEALNGKGAKCMFSVLLACGLVCSIYALTNWDSLPPDQQATAVVNLVGVVYGIGQAVPDIIDITAWATEGLAAKLQPAMAEPAVLELLEVTEQSLLISGPKLPTTFFGWLAPRFDSLTKTLNSAGTKVAAFFKIEIVANIIKVASAVLAAAGFAISVWTLVSDLNSDSDGVNVAFDTAQAALSFVVLACAIGAFIPVVDVVLAIVGIAAAMIAGVLAVAQFLYNLINKQPTPAENYIKDVVQPLIATLTPPPAGWSPPQTT